LIDKCEKEDGVENRVGFTFPSLSMLDDIISKKRASVEKAIDYNIYQRFGNPTISNTEKAIAVHEKCSWAVLAPSGMAAIDIAMSVFSDGSKHQKWCFFREIYSGTRSYVDNILCEKRGIEVSYFSHELNGLLDLEALEVYLDEIKPEILYFEIITNPLSLLVDYQSVIAIAKKRKIKIIIDNTLGTPYLFRPLEHNADLVVHSATKYISGKNNLLAGVVCGNNNHYEYLAREYRKSVGIVLYPAAAATLALQMQDLKSRFMQQSKTASMLASYLRNSKSVVRVEYPGFFSEKVNMQDISDIGNSYSDCGAVITFWLEGNDLTKAKLKRDMFVEGLLHPIKCSTSLGSFTTTIIHIGVLEPNALPLNTMALRLSVGLEPYDYLQDSLESGISNLKHLT